MQRKTDDDGVTCPTPFEQWIAEKLLATQGTRSARAELPALLPYHQG